LLNQGPLAPTSWRGMPKKAPRFYPPPPLDLDSLLDNLLIIKSVFESLGTTSDRKIIHTLKGGLVPEINRCKVLAFQGRGGGVQNKHQPQARYPLGSPPLGKEGVGGFP